MTTTVTRKPTAVGSLVTRLMSHPMDAVMTFDVNHFTFRTQRHWATWDISRVDYDLTRNRTLVASVFIEHNPTQRHPTAGGGWPTCKEFVVCNADGAVLEDCDTLAAALGAAITAVMFEPMLVRKP